MTHDRHSAETARREAGLIGPPATLSVVRVFEVGGRVVLDAVRTYQPPAIVREQ